MKELSQPSTVLGPRGRSQSSALSAANHHHQRALASHLNPQSSVLSPVFGAGVAGRYDGFRGLPDAIADRVHERIAAATDLSPAARVLDLGAGTGRLARPFLTAGYRYTGIDISAAMLGRLRALPREGGRADIVLADGQRLPFADGAFDLILAVQVLGVIPDWPLAVGECRRVLRPGGSVILGRVTHAPDSLQAHVRRARMRLLEEWGIEARRPGADEEAAAEALAVQIGPVEVLPALAWRTEQRPWEAITANLSGWRVQALPGDLRERLQENLAQRVENEIGDLNAPRAEHTAFSLRRFHCSAVRHH